MIVSALPAMRRERYESSLSLAPQLDLPRLQSPSQFPLRRAVHRPISSSAASIAAPPSFSRYRPKPVISRNGQGIPTGARGYPFDRARVLSNCATCRTPPCLLLPRTSLQLRIQARRRKRKRPALAGRSGLVWGFGFSAGAASVRCLRA